MKRIHGFGLGLCLLWSSLATASGDGQPAESLPQIVGKQQQIRSEIEQGAGRFEQMPSIKKRRILDQQTRLFTLTQDKTSLDELSPDQRIQFDNLLGQINAAIANREDERMVCESVATTGSRMKTRVCKSVAQRDAERRNAQEGLLHIGRGGTAPRMPTN